MNKKKSLMASVRFEYVPLVLPARCARSMWVLTLSHNEWGGQFRPMVQPDGACRLECNNVKLIKGTGLEKHPDADKYSQTQEVRIASTPFTVEQVSMTFPVCASGATVNFFWHTHPALMLRNETTGLGKFGPPSNGDFVAHTILANYRNWKQNQQLNTTLVMAFEGAYVYTVLPHKFREVVDKIDAHVDAIQHTLTPEERETAQKGTPPSVVLESIRKELFAEIQLCAEIFQGEMQKFVESHPELVDLKGAPEIRDRHWSQVGHVPRFECGFARSLGHPDMIAFCTDNILTRTMFQRGYHIEFYPAPFDHDIVIAAPTRMLPYHP